MQNFRLPRQSTKRNKASLSGLFSALLIIALLLPTIGFPTAPASAASNNANSAEKAIFFVSDGMRQDLVETYADIGLMPAMKKLLRTGAKAADGGLLTQAPTNTG